MCLSEEGYGVSEMKLRQGNTGMLFLSGKKADWWEKVGSSLSQAG